MSTHIEFTPCTEFRFNGFEFVYSPLNSLEQSITKNIDFVNGLLIKDAKGKFFRFFVLYPTTELTITADRSFTKGSFDFRSKTLKVSGQFGGELCFTQTTPNCFR